VKENSLDAGFGFDGDGDRLGVVDDIGKIQWGDRLMILYAKEILRKMPGSKIIFDVKCSKSLEEEIKKAGGIPLMWKTGHSLIENKLHQENAPLAGELSGHLYFADEYYGYDDAIYASLRLLRVMDNEGKKLSELFSEVKDYNNSFLFIFFIKFDKIRYFHSAGWTPCPKKVQNYNFTFIIREFNYFVIRCFQRKIRCFL